MGDQVEVYATWGKVIKSCSRADLEEMYKVGIKLYESVLQGTEMSLIKIAMEYLCMMFEPERVKYRIKDLHHEYGFKKIDHWMLFENCGVYMITIDKSLHEYYLVDKIYDHCKAKLEGMLKAKLIVYTASAKLLLLALFILLISVTTAGRTIAGLEFIDEHNEVAILQKPKQAEGFHQIVDFHKSSHISYALTVNPTICVEHLRKLWANATIYTEDDTQIIKTRDFSGKDIPLFSTMMGVSHSHGEASGSQPTSDHPTDGLPTPFHSVNIPQIPFVKTKSPITKTYIKKKVPGAKKPRGVEGVSARQKTPTKTSKDPSRVVNTPKGGEDRYNYVELMKTIANVNLDVIKQGVEIEEMKLVILSQQMQISNLKKMVLRLVQKKKRKQFVLQKRSIPHDASKKGDSQAEFEKQSPVRMESHFEGEIGAEVETTKEVENTSAAVTTPEVVTAVETDKVAAETGMSAEEIAIAETLVKAKNDTPKATQKAKGVLSTKLNEEFQRSLKTAAAAKKITKKASRQRLTLKIRQRQPSKTFLANQERRKMINFLKGVEVERKMKERHDLNIQQPFPDSEEGTPIKEKTEAKQEETLAQQIGAIKRKKSIATKPKAKRSRIEEVEKDIESARADPSAEPE
ncbi:hypothetical protein L6452_06101 [Arctium lappa]|uniref:Uncharacterized protein n=1 Tax=Arctium lappa TaxID=4217 RepID=A0ACB9EIJ0_ARCLA|nr:hypothetical protein L6452_06101 [Arctium lappa]